MQIILSRHQVPTLSKSERLSEYTVELFSDFIPSRKGIKKAIKKGLININGKPGTTGYFVKADDEITLLQESIEVKTIPMDLQSIYEDHHLCAIIKPPGIHVSGHHPKTILNGLAQNVTSSNALDKLVLPYPVHRLDKATSGILLIVKTKSALIALSKLFQERKIEKHYTAIVKGLLPSAGIIQIPLKGKTASTHFNTIQRVQNQYIGAITLAKIQIHTGRTHQIRKHLSKLGHPIVGDQVYGDSDTNKSNKGLMLAATKLALTHPITGELLSLSIPNPKKFENIMKRITLEPLKEKDGFIAKR